MNAEHPFERLRPGGPHIFRTLGYRMLPSHDGRAVIEWDATEEYGFPTGSGTIVHGGMITTLLDQVMGHASVAALQETGDSFLTADLQVESTDRRCRGCSAARAGSPTRAGASSSARPSS